MGGDWPARLVLLQAPQERDPHKFSPDWDMASSPLRVKSQMSEGSYHLPERPFHCPGGLPPLVPGHTHIPHAGLSEAVLNFSNGCHSPDCLCHFMVPH